jgi:UMF1 family MFS transporter
MSVDAKTYQRRVWAWTMYDWANSAFATTILAAVLPIYFSQVAGATLPSAAVATSYWSYGLSISLLIVALLSPVLGTISDVMRGKKRFLAIFAGLGIFSTAALVFVSTGDWILASILAILGRIGFNGSISFYDSLLPHVARPDDQDRVSTRGYAMGYLGGGLLLAVNIVMIQFLPGTWGARLSFLSVAIWWAVFSIPLFRHIPEPPALGSDRTKHESILTTSFKRLGHTLADIRRYRELFKFLIAFLIYNDGIGTIIGVAAIYGAELGFGSTELVLALLLVQFVGIPYSIVFGRIPNQNTVRRGFYLAFILYNLVMLPLVGVVGAQVLPTSLSGGPAPRFETTPGAYGEGVYLPDDLNMRFEGRWSYETVSASVLGSKSDGVYAVSSDADARVTFNFNGQKLRLTYAQGPNYGTWNVLVDGKPVIDPDTNQPLQIQADNPTLRYEMNAPIDAGKPGQHTLTLSNTGAPGSTLSLGRIEVLPGVRQSNLGLIIGLILLVEAIGLGFSYVLGERLFGRLANRLNTKTSILLALSIYGVVAIWGFFINSVVEFWFLAWMVAVVQGGSQALSRSLYASMTPSLKSGEFFGLFGIMEKFSAIIGPLLFGLAGTIFGSSRPAVLSLIALFLIGGYLLTRVNVALGRQVARDEDAQEAG